MLKIGALFKKKWETRDQLVGLGLVTRNNFMFSTEHFAGAETAGSSLWKRGTPRR